MKSDSRRPTVSLGFGITAGANAAPAVAGAEKIPRARQPKILVVDRDPAVRRMMLTRLGESCAVEAVGDAKTALDACILARPNLAIIELPMMDFDGLEFLKELKSRWPQLMVIIVTADGSIREAVDAIQRGAFGYLVKPVEREELLGQVQRALAGSTYSANESNWQAGLAARSQLLTDRLAIANRAAAGLEPVLLAGQSGTGKELFARAIHAASPRRAGPFVVVSCRDSPADALNLELFGGGAHPPSAFKRARGGTLLLDEIGDLPAEVQVPLAEALTRAQIRESPASRKIGTSVRVICTSSCDLEPLVKSGKFLKDLPALINGLPIEMAPLGRRREDIPSLVSHFLEQAVEPGGRGRIYSPQEIEQLATSDWPKHVRQLFDLMKRSMALSSAPQPSQTAAEAIPTYEEAREQFSRDYLAQNLQRTAGNVTQAALLAKRTRTDFYKLLARYRVNPNEFKAGNADEP